MGWYVELLQIVPYKDKIRIVSTVMSIPGQFLARCKAGTGLSETLLDGSGHVIAQFLRSLQRSLDPDNLHLARRDLSRRFAVTSRSHQAALVAGQHASKDRHGTFLRLRMRTAEADQSLRTMLSGG